jgi:TonB-dependent starch-binding outer membrane protein SusC
MDFTALCSIPRRAGFTKTMRIMKITALLVLLGFLHVSATSFSQNVTLSLKNASLEKIFTEIERQTGYNFIYFQNQLDKTRTIDLEAVNLPLESTLELIFKDQPLTYSIERKFIVVKEKTPGVVGVDTNNTVAALPPGEVHGKVTDSTGAPLEGVNVSVKGAKKGTVTGADGVFILKDVPDGAELVVSSVGYGVQIVKWGGKDVVRVVMHVAVQSMENAVVYKGYYSTTEQLNTGDVTTVKGETINEQPVSDPILALEGRVPGLYIQQASGIPGAYSSIGIMGPNSIANGNDPLYIIDGVPFSPTSLSIPNVGGSAVGAPGNPTFNQSGASLGGGGISPFNSLNPADIESIVVLKDADATAIYGSRGANGVILITTKKGKAGTTRADLNVYTGGGEVTRMMHLLNTTQYLAMRREAFQNDGLTLPSITTSPTDNNYDIDGFWDTTRYTNWQKVLIGNTARFTNAQGTISGGNANTQFLIGGGYSTQGTPYIGNYYDNKIMGNASLTHTSTNQRFHLQLGINYGYDNNKIPTSDFTQTSLNLAPDAPALFRNGNLNWQLLNGTYTFYNPAAATYQNAKAGTQNLISDLNLSYQLLPGLKLLSTFGYTHDEMHQTNYEPASPYPPPYNTDPAIRSSLYGTTTLEKWIIEPQLNYQQNIGLGRLEALIGTTFEQNTSNYFALEAYGFTSDALITDPLAAASTELLADNDILYRYNAIYGRFGYNWAEKYLVNFTARRDGSSRFGPGKQFGNFGAGGIGWIFSKENFIQRNLPIFSYGKVRASYGITGNDQIADYQYLSTYTPLSNSYEGLNGLSPTQLTNPYFAWEVVKKLEGGIDLGFLKDRVLISVTYYRNRTGNQLVGYSLPYITGFNSVQANLPAVVQNTGLELTLNTTPIKSKDFSWNLGGNLTVPSNKLISFPGLNASSYANNYVVGQSLFIQKLFHFAGVNPQTGLYSFATKNAYGLPGYPQDLVTTKPITQKYYGGFNNKLSYKGFSLDVFVQFVDELGLKYRTSGQPGSVNENEPTAILNPWQSPGDLTSEQRFGTNGTTSTPYAYYNASDALVTNQSFVRLKNLALSYQLPGSWKSKSHLENARIYLQCQNLFTITKFLGLDPETGSYSLPPLRMITAGLQVGF